MLAALYDIHGNLPALEAVLEDARELDVDHWLLGGDFGAWSPWAQETIELLGTLSSTTWIRGNGERWIRELPWDRPEIVEQLENFDSGLGNDEGWLYSLQERAEIEGVLYVHGCPLRDDDSFAKDPEPDDVTRLAGIRNRTVVFGHSHIQFQREGPFGNYLVNPGSVGMPLDGDVGAAYALWHGGRAFEFRRVAYDNEKAAAAYESLGSPFGAMAAARIRRGSD
jgi:diadenosine tetraphosphatase ApaH/serine/threonine PP2A family protein phosphatase